MKDREIPENLECVDASFLKEGVTYLSNRGLLKLIGSIPGKAVITLYNQEEFVEYKVEYPNLLPTLAEKFPSPNQDNKPSFVYLKGRGELYVYASKDKETPTYVCIYDGKKEIPTLILNNATKA
jgi:hypothetical protein